MLLRRLEGSLMRDGHPRVIKLRIWVRWIEKIVALGLALITRLALRVGVASKCLPSHLLAVTTITVRRSG